MAVKGTIVPKHVALTMTILELQLIIECMASWNDVDLGSPLNELEQDVLDALLKILNA